MSMFPDRYRTVGRRDFATAVEYMLETEFKLVGSHRVIRMIVESIMELHRGFFPETKHQRPGTILWATTKAGDGAKVSWGKRAESYGVQMVQLPLVTKSDIESRMVASPGRDRKAKRSKMFRREMATVVRLVKSAADQGGLLTGAELSLLMNRSLPKIHEYIRAYEAETGEALPLKGSVLDMGSSPTHKGVICGKFEEGMSPPDIARATSHNLGSVDKYLGTYGRIKVLLRKGFDAEAICQVTGKGPRTVAQYLEIVDLYHPDLLSKEHRRWLAGRRKKVRGVRCLPAESVDPMMAALKKGGSPGSTEGEIVDPGGSGEVDSKGHAAPKGRRSLKRAQKRRGNK
jgi:hypothetical protein